MKKIIILTLLPFKFTWEEWWQHWLVQKKKWGLVCPYTRVTMTMIKGLKKRYNCS